MTAMPPVAARASILALPAASPRTRPASCCGCSPRPATTYGSCRPTSALHFVGAPTWAALSGEPGGHRASGTTSTRCRTSASAARPTWSSSRPATADLLARAAHGRADDLLTATLLTARCPVLFAPAMHTEMWEHPATRANVATLRARGVHRARPGVGRLTGADTGVGRLPDPAEIFAAARAVLARGAPPLDLAGRHVVVSAGGTREPLDPVRFLGNRSSGRQGYALARAAAGARRRGHARRGQRVAARPGRRQGRAGRPPPPSCATAVLDGRRRAPTRS